MRLDHSGTNTTPHNHTCESCGVVWCHDPIGTIKDLLEAKDKVARDLAEVHNQNAHQCPGCGHEQYRIDDEDGTDPQYLHDGKTTPIPVSCRPPVVDTCEVSVNRLMALVMMAQRWNLLDCRCV